MERSAAATVLATGKAAATTGTKDVIVDFGTDMLLWLDAFRRVTDAETQVIHLLGQRPRAFAVDARHRDTERTA